MRKVLLPFTVTPGPVVGKLLIVKVTEMTGNELARVIVNRLVVMSNPGSLVGMAKSIVLPAVAAKIACRKLPAPVSSVFITVGAACELITPSSKHIPTKLETFSKIFFIFLMIYFLVFFPFVVQSCLNVKL